MVGLASPSAWGFVAELANLVARTWGSAGATLSRELLTVRHVNRRGESVRGLFNRAPDPSSVNIVETYGKMMERRKRLEDVVYQIEWLRIPVTPFDTSQAQIAASVVNAGAPAFRESRTWSTRLTFPGSVKVALALPLLTVLRTR